MSRAAHIANSSISALVGLLCGYLLTGTDNNGKDDSHSTKPKPGAPKTGDTLIANSARTRTSSDVVQNPVTNSPRKVEFSEDWGVLPAAAFAGSSLKLLMPGQLRIDPQRAMLIGVRPERADAVNAVLQSLEQKVQAHESKAAVKRSGPDGDFYLIPASAELRSDFDGAVEGIRQQFADNPPVGEALLSAVFHGSDYSSFGRYDEEVSLRDVTAPGGSQTVAETILRNPKTGYSVGGRNMTLNTSILLKRYPFFGKK
jgi:hypothetical protein